MGNRARRRDDHHTCLVNYIHFNPQHHEFVSDFREWPHSSYPRYISEEYEFLALDKMKEWFGTMKSEWNRYLTFYNNWDTWTLSAEALAQAGFFFLNFDETQCAFCRGKIRGWYGGMDPWEEHGKHFPLCPFLFGEDVGNIPIDVDPLTLGRDVCD